MQRHGSGERCLGAKRGLWLDQPKSKARSAANGVSNVWVSVYLSTVGLIELRTSPDTTQQG